MTTLCIGVLQRVDISVSGLQAVILANTDADAQEFRGIIDVLCRGDPNVSQDPTVRLRPTHVLVATQELIHNMIIQQTANSDDVKIYIEPRTSIDSRLVAERCTSSRRAIHDLR